MTEEVRVVWGDGVATTPLTAFDAALAAAGLADYNLVTYSSIVPAGCAVAEVGTVDLDYAVGDPVGVVLAENHAATPGESVAAGLGWALAEEGGVFMESTAATAEACRVDLERKLADARDRRDWTWRREADHVVRETAVGDGTTAVVVGAVYGRLAYDERLHG